MSRTVIISKVIHKSFKKYDATHKHQTESLRYYVRDKLAGACLVLDAAAAGARAWRRR